MLRNPDGRSLGAVHNLVWQISALMLAQYEVSQAWFEALMGQLQASVRRWGLRPVSRNYLYFLGDAFGG